MDIEQAILEAAELMDAQNIPKEGRIFRFVGRDGNVYEYEMPMPEPEPGEQDD